MGISGTQGSDWIATKLVFISIGTDGILWQASRIIPAQEHMASPIIRQKITGAIEGLPHAYKSAPLFLLMLPEDEFQETGLLYMYYQLKKLNFPVIYLGASVPLKDAAYFYEIKKPRFICLHLSSFPRQPRFENS
jgi:MerR family transcriptional regulator, light-induced transcriptional regulator